MTRTCDPCNHGLGSRVEADLVDWFDEALTIPSFSGGGVPGKRQSSRLLVRWTPAGELVLLPDRQSDPAIAEILASGEADLEASRPDRNRYSIALLKSLYLAVCIKSGVPEGEHADRVRATLIAARDARSKDDVPTSPIALELTVLRHYGPPLSNDPVVIAAVQTQDGLLVGILFAGRVFVSAPPQAEQEAPSPTPRLAVRLKVGKPLQGEVASVFPEPPPRPQQSRRKRRT